MRHQVKRADRGMQQVMEMAALVIKEQLLERKYQGDLLEGGTTDTSARTTYIIK